MRLAILVFAAGLTASGAARAQAVDDVWKVMAGPASGDDWWDVELTLEPKFNIDGDRAAFPERRDIEADGEYSIGAILKRELGAGTVVSLSPSLTASPHWFDEAEAQSAASLGARLQHTFTVRRRDGRPADSIVLYGKYKAGWRWNRFFEDEGPQDQTYEIGATATDIRYWLCGRGQTPGNAQTSGTCDGPKGLRWAYTGAYAVTTSSNPNREFEGPIAEIALRSPIGETSAIDVELNAQHRSYAQLRNDSGLSTAEADRLSATVRFTISAAAHRFLPTLKDFKVQIGFKWVDVNSDNAQLDGREFSVIPTFTRSW